MMLKSARQALHTLQSSSRPAASAALQNTRNAESNQIRSSPKVRQCGLPGGFFCLNPNVEVSSSQRPPQPTVTAVEVQASKPQPNPQPSTCFLPIFPVNAPTLQASTTSAIERRASISQKSKPTGPTPLKKEYLEAVSKDSRLARWQRVLAFVHDQRQLPTITSSTDRPVTAPSEATANIWDDEEDKRSLWSGGSAGTNGVHEYVWDEDLYEQQQPQITIVPEPKLANRPAFVPLCLTPEVSPPPPAPKPQSQPVQRMNEYKNHVPQDEGIFVLDAEEEGAKQEEVKSNPLIGGFMPLSLNPVSSFVPSRNPWDLPKEVKRRMPIGDEGWNKRWTVAEIGL
ncbi:hypothetical protein BJ508DRAFT_413532 [Ascobolus immersus RN42]|uniref:Uncharacterized protein n=1 Tax=Ascobolus immersus RN42 TaxID=1160509 RepID=A0A3N4IB64_ASCIM|nr:hypothetical protein BJ508DRAFT_413532 [Ascobolus immersus RN42]